MTRIDNIYDEETRAEVSLPENVVVAAQAKTLEALAPLANSIRLVECGVDEMPSGAVLTQASIIVTEVDPRHEGSIKRLDAIAARNPDVPIIAGVEALDIRTTRALLKRGVTDVLELPFSIDELVGAIADVDLSQLEAATSSATLAPVVSVIGCSGGVGTTTIATHLAGIWCDDEEQPAILDLDLQKGDVESYMGMPGKFSLQDLIERGKRLDAELLKSVLIHRDGMPDVLAAPRDILPIEEIEFEMLQPVIKELRKRSDLLVIDMPDSLTNWGLATLFASDRIVLVGGMSVNNLRKLRRQIDFLVSMGIDRTAIKVVLNKVPTGFFKTISTSEAEEALRHDVLAAIPEDTTCLQQAQDQGLLIWGVSSKTKFEKAILELSEVLFESDGGET